MSKSPGTGPGESDEVEDTSPQTLRERTQARRAGSNNTTRAMIILAIVVALLTIYGVSTSRSQSRAREAEHKFEVQIIANCLNQVKTYSAITLFIKQQKTNVDSSKTILPDAKANADSTYETLLGAFDPAGIKCPPSFPGSS